MNASVASPPVAAGETVLHDTGLHNAGLHDAGFDGPARPSRLRRAVDFLLGKVVTLVLAAGALALGIATFVMLAGGVSWACSRT